MPMAKNNQLGGGLEATLYALKHFPTIVESVSTLIALAFKNNFDKIIAELRQNHVQNNMEELP